MLQELQDAVGLLQSGNKASMGLMLTSWHSRLKAIEVRGDAYPNILDAKYFLRHSLHFCVSHLCLHLCVHTCICICMYMYLQILCYILPLRYSGTCTDK